MSTMRRYCAFAMIAIGALCALAAYASWARGAVEMRATSFPLGGVILVGAGMALSWCAAFLAYLATWCDSAVPNARRVLYIAIAQVVVALSVWLMLMPANLLENSIVIVITGVLIVIGRWRITAVSRDVSTPKPTA